MIVTVVSSFAVDRLISDSGISFRDGGPAFFITRTLEGLGVKYSVVSSGKANVDIDMRDDKEQGKIVQVEKIVFNPEISPDFVLVSTLSDEFDLMACGKFNCLDIQGYVRDGRFFGTKRVFGSEELGKFDIIKGTVAEIKYVPENILSKVPIVVVTNGSEGFRIYCKNKEYFFNVDKLVVPDTIGAGDTFFAVFCVKYYETRNIFQSAIFAKSFVNDFLKKKLVF